MRWAFSKAFWLIGWGLTFVMMVKLFLAWLAGVGADQLVLIYFAFFIPIVLSLFLAARLKEPRQKQRKVCPASPTIPQVQSQPLPEPPPRPQERRIAMPPVVGVPNAQIAPVRASMPDRLRRFVIEGEAEIVEDRG